MALTNNEEMLVILLERLSATSSGSLNAIINRLFSHVKSIQGAIMSLLFFHRQDNE